MASVDIQMTVNGRPVKQSVSPHLRLLDFLRDGLHWTGSKEGCGAGECGTCSVFVDGVLMKSCLMPVAKAQHSKIETIEGLEEQGKLNVLQQAFQKTGASQCGYCIPGMMMAATAALRANPNIDREEIKERLGGNICRCTGYQKIFEATELARDVMNGTLPITILQDENEEGPYIGRNSFRIDTSSKVTGGLKYAGDMVMPQMLYMQVLRSPHPHAEILELDTTVAESMEGVEAVVTYRDVQGIDGFGVFTDDQPVLARGKVRYVGESVAAVAAEDLLTAKQALKKIKVRYRKLPVITEPEDAIKSGASIIHDDVPDNIVMHIPIRKGNVEKGMAESDLVVEETYHTQPVEHAYLEPEAGLAYLDADGTLVIQSPSQNITHHRHKLAKILDMPVNRVRMIMSPVGGGFGGKEDMHYQGILALAVLKCRRPIRYVFTREESIIASAKRHPFRIQYQLGINRDGRIHASRIHMLADAGAYNCSTEGVMRKAAILAAGPYSIENLKVDAIGVYTNNTPSGAMRTFGAMQSQFATECHLDLCAEKLDMDPVKLRHLNFFMEGNETHTRQKLGSVSMLEVFNSALDLSGWESGFSNSRGATRSDLGQSGTRPPCTLRARQIPLETTPTGQAV